MRTCALAVTAILGVGACRSAQEVCTGVPPGAVIATVQDRLTRAARAYGSVLVVRDGEYSDSVVGSFRPR
jgi:hypothetical protein